MIGWVETHITVVVVVLYFFLAYFKIKNYISISYRWNFLFTLLVGWLVVFYVPSTAKSFRDDTPFYCPLWRTWSWVNTLFPLGIEPGCRCRQSITLPLCHARSTIFQMTCLVALKIYLFILQSWWCHNFANEYWIKIKLPSLSSEDPDNLSYTLITLCFFVCYFEIDIGRLFTFFAIFNEWKHYQIFSMYFAGWHCSFMESA